MVTSLYGWEGYAYKMAGKAYFHLQVGHDVNFNKASVSVGDYEFWLR